MKKHPSIFIGLSLALVVIAAGATGCDTLTPPPKATSPAGGVVLSQQNTGVWVTGEGKVTVVPDVAILSLGVEAQAATVSEAQSQAAGAMNAITGELDSYGIASKDIKTQNFSIYPVRKWDEARQEEILIGYRVTNTVTAKVRKVGDAGAVIEATVRAGGDYTRINDISFTVDDPSPYQKDARQKAMADAEARAKQLADSANIKLGPPTYVSESGGAIPIIRDNIALAPVPGPMAPAPPPVSPGETEIQVFVQVVYSIR